jgi:hypothetical protein
VPRFEDAFIRKDSGPKWQLPPQMPTPAGKVKRKRPPRVVTRRSSVEGSAERVGAALAAGLPPTAPPSQGRGTPVGRPPVPEDTQADVQWRCAEEWGLDQISERLDVPRGTGWNAVQDVKASGSPGGAEGLWEHA